MMCLCCSKVTCSASTKRACVSSICAWLGSSHCVTAAAKHLLSTNVEDVHKVDDELCDSGALEQKT